MSPSLVDSPWTVILLGRLRPDLTMGECPGQNEVLRRRVTPTIHALRPEAALLRIMQISICADTLVYLQLLDRDVAEGPDEAAALALQYGLSENFREIFEPLPDFEQTHVRLVWSATTEGC